MIPKGTDPLLSPVSKLPTSILMQMHAVTSSTFCVHNAFIFQWNESPDQKTVVLCGISRSLFLFLEYKNVKIVDFTKDRSNYHLRAEFRAFEWEERYKFRGLLYKFEERSILSRSFTVEKARVEPTSYKIRARWEPRSEKGCLGLLNGEFRLGTGCHPRVDLQYRKLRHDKTIKRDTVYDQWIIFPFDCVSILVLFKIWKEIDEFSNISIISSISSKPTLWA